jgi:uncharacterized membrane protein
MNLPAIVDRLRARMPLLRAAVPIHARALVVVLAVGLCFATFGPWLSLALGVELPAWEAFAYGACGPFCHQLSERSFQVAGHTAPLCTRCTGMWIGITLGVALGVLASPRRRWSVGLGAMVLALALSEADHLREESGHPGWAWVRFWLGLIIFLGLTTAISYDILALLVHGWRRLSGSSRRRDRA